MNEKTKSELEMNLANRTHIMSVDVEDYFMVEAFSGSVKQSTWGDWPSRVVNSTRRALDLFDKYDVKGTFFFVGWVAKKFPELVRDVQARGHELACHSYWHRTVYSLTPEEFRKDTRAAMQAIEDAAGVKVYGYRAPSWSITKDSLWALDILSEEGFTYDSSIYPIHHDLYGVPGAQRFPYTHRCANGMSLLEIPPATVEVAGQNFPAAGGGYLRIFPMAYTRWAFGKFEKSYGEKVVVYFHPWEFDPDQPRIGGSLKSRFRHYTNLKEMGGRVETLLREYKFHSFRDLLEADRMNLEGIGNQETIVLTVAEALEVQDSEKSPRHVTLKSQGGGSIVSAAKKSENPQRQSRGVRALTYHSINSGHLNSPYDVSCEELEKHLQIAHELQQSNGERTAKVEITFDDGHVSNFMQAAKVLDKYRTKATFFVVASFMNSRADYMTWEQLLELASAGHEIQSHSWSHPMLTQCSDKDLQFELEHSRRVLEQALGMKVDALGVPGGRWDVRVLEAARRAGYKRVYVSDPWLAPQIKADVELFGRFTVKKNLKSSDLTSVLTGEGLATVRIKAQYNAKEVFRRVVGDHLYRRVWASMKGNAKDEVVELAGAAAAEGEPKQT